jgi:hypothetical protein
VVVTEFFFVRLLLEEKIKETGFNKLPSFFRL